MARRRGENLESWLIWLRDALVSGGAPATLYYDDRIGGDVLVLIVGADDPERLVAFTTTRRVHGQAHLTVLAATRTAAATLAAQLEATHRDVPRVHNAKRKFVHRFARMTRELDTSWDERNAATPIGHREALIGLRATTPGARPLCGIGFHTDLAGAEDHHTREKYPSLWGVALPTSSGWRAVPWDEHARVWTMSASTNAALGRPAPNVPVAAIAGAGVVAGAAATAFLIEPPSGDAQRKSGCNASCGDICDPSWAIDLANLGDCVPDCSSFDCGSLDCSL